MSSNDVAKYINDTQLATLVPVSSENAESDSFEDRSADNQRELLFKAVNDLLSEKSKADEKIRELSASVEENRNELWKAKAAIHFQGQNTANSEAKLQAVIEQRDHFMDREISVKTEMAQMEREHDNKIQELKNAHQEKEEAEKAQSQLLNSARSDNQDILGKLAKAKEDLTQCKRECLEATEACNKAKTQLEEEKDKHENMREAFNWFIGLLRKYNFTNMAEDFAEASADDHPDKDAEPVEFTLDVITQVFNNLSPKKKGETCGLQLYRSYSNSLTKKKSKR